MKRCNRIIIEDEIITLTKKHIDNINDNAKLMAKDALRVLCDLMTVKHLKKKNLIFGLVGMIDPPREK